MVTVEVVFILGKFLFLFLTFAISRITRYEKLNDRAADDFYLLSLLNPLSPKSDQDQFSPNNNHTLSRDKL